MSFRVEKNVMVPMRDGVQLATDIWIPESDAPVATLLVRLPYGKESFPAGEFDYPTMPNVFRLLEAGYALVYQDCRGTGGSEGTFEPMISEALDGVDTVEWLVRQDWCDGRIGSYGHSYLGMTQWATASMAPNGLKAIAPAITTTDPYRYPWYSAGGAMSWHAVWFWSTLMLTLATNTTATHDLGPEEIAVRALDCFERAEEELIALPVADRPLLAEVWDWWAKYFEHSHRDSYWRDQAPVESIANVDVPALHIGGWFDVFADDTIKTFVRAKRDASTEAARAGQRLIIGPWDHLYFNGAYHDRQFGVFADLATVDLTQTHLDFFDRNIRELDSSEESSPVRIFVMGKDEWRDEPDWPLRDTLPTEFFLSSRQGANTKHGDGTLELSSPASSTDSYDYDPSDPVPSVGGRLMAPVSLNGSGPVDQSDVEDRADVLCYTTEPLVDAIEVTGEISAELFVSSSARDTDFTVKLVDVFPDGRAIYLTDGILRMRHRSSLETTELMNRDAVYAVTIDAGVTSNVFMPGHRIRIEISSSNFPRYDRNTNTGNDIAFDRDAPVTARNTVHLGGVQPSRVVLPVIPPRVDDGHVAL